MDTQDVFFLVNEKALPAVFTKVLQAKQLMDSGKVRHVQEATLQVGISRSVFYKYRDLIFPYHVDTKGKTITFAMNLDNVPGILSRVLSTVANSGANILTINQTISINGIANITITISAPPSGADNMFHQIALLDGLSALKIVNRE